jgi:2-amino-4-hydroxy-6-hydroxymethyldihydropteridine diphosphokinase
MNTAYILLGGNIGNRLEQLRNAKNQIAEAGCIIDAHSAIYETAAWGFKEQPSFYNCVLKIQTKLSANELLITLLGIEKLLGRNRNKNERWQQRIIDIDILLFNNDIIETENLVIPHPQLHNRKFTLLPLSALAANYVHPVLKKTIAELLLNCSDELEVKPIKDAL